MLETIRQIDLHSDIRARLERYIREQGLSPGDRLPSENQLAAALGVSRSALREAFRSLEAVGLVEARHGKGRYLNGFSFDKVGVTLGYLLLLDASRAAELLEIRRALEVAFFPDAATRLTPSDIDELRSTVGRMRELRQAGLPMRPAEAVFHATLFRRSPNLLLQELLAIFWKVMEKVGQSGMLPPSRAPHMADTHGQIVELVATGNVDHATKLLSSHYDDLMERLQALAASLRSKG